MNEAGINIRTSRPRVCLRVTHFYARIVASNDIRPILNGYGEFARILIEEKILGAYKNLSTASPQSVIRQVLLKSYNRIYIKMCKYLKYFQ